MPETTTEEATRLDEVRAFALAKFAEHGLDGWTFGFDRAVRRFGLCYRDENRITMSRVLSLAATDGEWKDTVLHEIAHALAPRDAGHNSKWREVAVSIGCTGEQYHHLPTREITPHTHLGVCPQGHKTSAYRKVDSRCAYCVRRFAQDSRFEWTQVTDSAVLPKRPMKRVCDPRNRRDKKCYIGECPSCGYAVKGGSRRKAWCVKCSPVYDERFRIVWTEDINTSTFEELVRAALENSTTNPAGFATEVALKVMPEGRHGDKELITGFVAEVVERALTLLIRFVLDTRTGLDPSSVPTRSECESLDVRSSISHVAKLVRRDSAEAVMGFLEVATKRAA